MRFFSLFPLHLQSIADLENAARLATVFAEAYTNDTLSQVDNFLKVEKNNAFCVGVELANLVKGISKEIADDDRAIDISNESF